MIHALLILVTSLCASPLQASVRANSKFDTIAEDSLPLRYGLAGGIKQGMEIEFTKGLALPLPSDQFGTLYIQGNEVFTEDETRWQWKRFGRNFDDEDAYCIFRFFGHAIPEEIPAGRKLLAESLRNAELDLDESTNARGPGHIPYFACGNVKTVGDFRGVFGWNVLVRVDRLDALSPAVRNITYSCQVKYGDQVYSEQGKPVDALSIGPKARDQFWTWAVFHLGVETYDYGKGCAAPANFVTAHPPSVWDWPYESITEFEKGRYQLDALFVYLSKDDLGGDLLLHVGRHVSGTVHLGGAYGGQLHLYSTRFKAEELSDLKSYRLDPASSGPNGICTPLPVEVSCIRGSEKQLRRAITKRDTGL